MGVWSSVRFTAFLALGLCAVSASAQARALKPVAGKSVVLEAQSGTVTVTAKGSSRASRLQGIRVVRLGATIDASKGKVGLLASGQRRRGCRAAPSSPRRRQGS